MKAYFFLILLVLINTIFNSNIDLKNGEKQSFNLIANYTYYFFIPMNQFQAAKIYIDFNNISPNSFIPFSNVILNEYLTREGQLVKSCEINFTKTDNQKILAIESEYFFDENPRNYISLSITTNSSIGDTTILVDIFGGYYEIIENNYLEFNKFYSGFPYYLTFKAKPGNKLNILLSFSKIEELDINNLTFIEYKDINHTIMLNSIDYIIEKQSSGSSKIIDLSYIIKNSETNLFIIKLYPKNHTISDFHASITVDKFYFYLNLNQVLNIEKLIPDSYYFSIEANKNLLTNISLNMNYKKEELPLSTLSIYETDNAFSDTHLESKFITINSPSQSFIYNIINNNTKFLLIILKPQYEFEQIKITYTSTKELITTYNMMNGKAIDIRDMQPKIPYYFDIDASFLKTLYFTFTIDNVVMNPFNSFNIYENLNKINNNSNKVEIISSPISKNENQYKGNLLYTIYDSSTSKITLKIEPEYFINLMNIKIDVGGELNKLKDGKSNEYTDLSSNFRYFFKIDVNNNKNATFTIEVNNRYTTHPFKNIIIHEMSNKIIESKNYNRYSFSEKGDDIIIEIFCEINSTSTNINELMLELELKSNIDIMNIRIDLDYKGKDNSTLIIALSIVGVIVVIACIVFIIIIVKKKNPSSNLIDKLPPSDKPSELLANLD